MENIKLTVTEKNASYLIEIIDEYIDEIPYKHNHRGTYVNTIIGRNLLLEDEFLSDEQKQKILTFWGDPLPEPIEE